MVLSASSACALHNLSHMYVDVGGKDPGWKEISNYARKSKMLTLALPQPSGHIEVAQFIKVKTMAVLRDSPGWAWDHQPCGLQKHGYGDRVPNLNHRSAIF